MPNLNLPEDAPNPTLLSRRGALAALGATVAFARTGQVPAAATAVTQPPQPTWGNAYGLVVAPRSAWVPTNAPVVANLDVEPSVAVLIVHHSETSNTYAVEDGPKVLRSFRAYHMSRKKGWPDVAYNFFVDRFGGVWEGRTGSLIAPVAGSATGGNQGGSQLVCLVGNHHTVPPTEAALASLTNLLATLADHYMLPLEPDATTEFASRGSTRWPAGATVRTRTIEGHRGMSMTPCPGDAAFRILPTVRGEVHRLRAAAVTATSASAQKFVQRRRYSNAMSALANRPRQR